MGRRDTILFAKGYGRLTWSPSARPVSPESTLYDLASLTKVVATTTAAMLLVERGKLDLDAPVAHYVPEFDGPGTAGITVRQWFGALTNTGWVGRTRGNSGDHLFSWLLRTGTVRGPKERQPSPARSVTS